MTIPAHLGFLRRLALTVLIAMVVWLALQPVLDGAVSRGAQLLVRAFEVPRVTRLVVVEHRVEIRRSDLRAGSAVLALPLAEIHFNTIVYLALALALPGWRSRRQLERLLIGGCLLYLTQCVNLIFHVKVLYATAMGPWSLQAYTDLARNVYAFGQYFTDLPGRFSFPFVIWLGLNWDVVTAMVDARDEGTARSQKRRPRSGS